VPDLYRPTTIRSWSALRIWSTVAEARRSKKAEYLVTTGYI
jgi:hypothetical protein